MSDDLKKLIDAHWSYVETLLKAHGTNHHVIKACEFHYKSAFEHGYKHCKEEYMVAGSATATNQPVERTSLSELLSEAIKDRRENDGNWQLVHWGE